jgi:hypothetical protein
MLSESHLLFHEYEQPSGRTPLHSTGRPSDTVPTTMHQQCTVRPSWLAYLLSWRARNVLPRELCPNADGELYLRVH